MGRGRVTLGLARVCVCVGGPYWRGTQGSRPQACDTSRVEDAVTPGQGRRCEVLG